MARRVALGLVLAAAVAGCSGPATRPADRPPSVVPWVDRPAAPYRPPAPRVVRYATSAPPCRARDLAIVKLRGAAGLGHVLERFGFLNVGETTCLLDGFPRVTGVTSDGAHRVVPARGTLGTWFGRILPADIAPDEHGVLDFETTDVCENWTREPRYHHLAVTLPAHRGTIIAPPHLALVAGCNEFELSRLGLPEQPPRDPPPRPGTADVLEVEAAIPHSVSAGSTLRFVVALRNPTSKTVGLDPCPRYEEGIYARRLSAVHWYELNCDSVRSIAPHAAVRYAMVLRIPASAGEGLAKFWWRLGEPTVPSSGTAFTITRS